MRANRSRLPEVGTDPPFAFPALLHLTLTNGLAVRLVPYAGLPVVTFVLVLEGGAAVDPADRHGLASVTGDMLDEGTGSMNALDVSDALARLGADYDLDVGADATILAMTTLSRFADRAADLLAAMAIRPSLQDHDFHRLRQLRLDRLRQLKDLAPAMAERAFLKLLYGTHPYGHLSLGSVASLERLGLSDVEAFHTAVYRPSRATLIIAGAIDEADAARLAERAFGGWEQKRDSVDTSAPASSVAAPDEPAARLAIVPREGAAQSELRIGHLSARRDTPDYFPLLVMNAVIGGQFVSRINLKLREEKGYTYGARTGFDWRRGLTPFVLQTSVHSRATADAVRDAVGELEAIRSARPPTADELTLAKASLTRGYPRNFETVPQVARAVAQLVLFGLPDTYFEAFAPNVQAVTAADVVRAAQRYIDPARLATLIVGDDSAIRDSLGALGLGQPLVLAAEV
jgi:predicted Zn-dependent peptidase